LAEVRRVLDERLGISEPLNDDALGLVVVEEDVVLQRPGVLGPHDLVGLSGQALEFVEPALVEPEPSDAQNLTHSSPPFLRFACVASRTGLTRFSRNHDAGATRYRQSVPRLAE